MMQTRIAGQVQDRLDPRSRRIVIAASSLVMALVVLLSGAGRAMAHPSTNRRPSPVAAAAQPTPTTTPSTTAPSAPAVQAPRPTATSVNGQEATVEIPSIKVSLPVVRGGQDVIDRGVAAHYTGAQWRPATNPGQPGTYWLAAHNVTHGSPFENLHAIAKGAEIKITSSDGTVFTYVVTSRDLVGTSTTLETVYGQDTTTPRILLQTCEGAAQRLLVHGTLTSVTAG
jgi:LPXTG-site transpeptidase (sortase) family protein